MIKILGSRIKVAVLFAWLYLNGHHSKLLVKSLNLIPIRVINDTAGTYMSNEKCDKLQLISSSDDLDLTNFPRELFFKLFFTILYSLKLTSDWSARLVNIDM